MRRWYQVVEIDGVDAVFEDKKRRYSKFWNQGKWNTFVAPLLPKERQTFLEIGCNAGLFLKMASDVGFKRITGADGNSRIMQQADILKKHYDGEWDLVNLSVGHDFKLTNLPLPDVTLLSNIHYYLPVGDFSKLVDELMYRTLYCIIVSAKAKRRRGNAMHDIRHVRGYFKDWEEVGVIENMSTDEDPAPREQMYGVIFKSSMSAIDVEEKLSTWLEEAKSKFHSSHEFAPAIMQFYTEVLGGYLGEIEDSPFYQYWRHRRPDQSPAWTSEFLYDKIKLAESIRDDGMKEPIYFGTNGKLLDGIHRLCIAKILGYDHVVARSFS